MLIQIHPTLPTPQKPVDTPLQKKIKQIAVGVVIIVFTPLVLAQLLKIVDLDKDIPFFIAAYWLLVITGLVIGVYIYVIKKQAKKKNDNNKEEMPHL